ncbi:MAG: hypothetical protein AAF362_01580 [Pseudomonadota bacterium]
MQSLDADTDEMNENNRAEKQSFPFETLTDFDMASVSDQQLSLMTEGIGEMLAVLGEAGQQNYHVLTNVLASKTDEPFTQWQHYPPGDVQDKENGAIWFYHAHQEDELARPWDEHGHFHLFRYTELLRPDAEAVSMPDEFDTEKGGLCHLVAVSFGMDGLPIRIFTTNRWVAGEWMYPADDVIALLDGYQIEGKPYELTTRWLQALLKLYRPQIEWALRERDRRLPEMAERYGDRWGDEKTVEVLSSVTFDLAAQIAAIEAESMRRNG